MKRMFLICNILILITRIQGQGFSKIMDYDPTGQCKHYLVFPKQDYIYVFGDYIDSARIAIRPFWAKYNYNGERLQFDTLWDNRFSYQLSFDQFMPYAFQNDSIIYIDALSFADSLPIGHLNLLKINLHSGKILNSILLNSDTFGIITYLTYDSTINKLISCTGSYDVKNKIEILEFNDKLIMTHRVVIEFDSTQANAPYYIRKTNNSYNITGETNTRFQIVSTVGYFTAKIDSIGNIQYYKKLESLIPLSGWTLNNYRIIERQDGDFIIGANYLVNNLPTPRDANLFAHPVRASANFDSIRWELKMYDKPNYLYPYQFYNGLISINNEREYIGYGDDLDTLSGSCVLYKFNEDGDSLWYKRIIPGDSNRDSLGWVPTYMAAESPRGGIVIVGSIYDKRRPNYNAIRSYIMYLDDDGCLIPDCNKAVSVKDVESGNVKYFNVYPNPIKDQLLVLCNYAHEQKYNFSLVNSEGMLVWKHIISCHQSDQIFWPIENIPSGNYYLQIQDSNGKIVQNEKLIKL